MRLGVGRGSRSEDKKRLQEEFVGGTPGQGDQKAVRSEKLKERGRVVLGGNGAGHRNPGAVGNPGGIFRIEKNGWDIGKHVFERDEEIFGLAMLRSFPKPIQGHT